MKLQIAQFPKGTSWIEKRVGTSFKSLRKTYSMENEAYAASSREPTVSVNGEGIPKVI